MGKTALAGKLRMQPGQRALVMNAPTGYIRGLEPLPEGMRLDEVAEGTYAFVHLFVKNVGELGRHGPVALESVTYDGTLWISYPKRSSKVKTDLSRDVGWEITADAGLRPVTQVSIDDTWSALRFRPLERVGKSK